MNIFKNTWLSTSPHIEIFVTLMLPWINFNIPMSIIYFCHFSNVTFRTAVCLYNLCAFIGCFIVVQSLRCVLLFCNLTDCSPPCSSVLGISQAKILKLVAISFSKGSSWPGIEPMSPALRVDSLPLSHQGNSLIYWWLIFLKFCFILFLKHLLI